MEVLKSLCKKESLSVLFSSHDLDLVGRYADEIWYLHDTKISIHSPAFASELAAAGAREL
jgi:ABC-type glutathione transport system ATPase component